MSIIDINLGNTALKATQPAYAILTNNESQLFDLCGETGYMYEEKKEEVLPNPKCPENRIQGQTQLLPSSKASTSQGGQLPPTQIGTLLLIPGSTNNIPA